MKRRDFLYTLAAGGAILSATVGATVLEGAPHALGALRYAQFHLPLGADLDEFTRRFEAWRGGAVRVRSTTLQESPRMRVQTTHYEDGAVLVLMAGGKPGGNRDVVRFERESIELEGATSTSFPD